jgi:hypothetical protein
MDGPRWCIVNELAPPVAESLNTRFDRLRHIISPEMLWILEPREPAHADL